MTSEEKSLHTFPARTPKSRCLSLRVTCWWNTLLYDTLLYESDATTIATNSHYPATDVTSPRLTNHYSSKWIHFGLKRMIQHQQLWFNWYKHIQLATIIRKGQRHTTSCTISKEMLHHIEEAVSLVPFRRFNIIHALYAPQTSPPFYY